MMTGEADRIRELTEAAFWSKVHRSRRDNPHEVTAEQVGAGSGGGDLEEVENRLLAVEAHVVDKDNPHEVTAEQVGATGGGGGGASSLLQYHPIWNRADISTITGLTGSMKWFGGVLAPDGKIYGIPGVSESVLIIDPVAGTADTTTITGLSTDPVKWEGGVLGPDGKIYGIPRNSASVLIIDPIAGTADTTTITGLTGTGKWSGGVLGPDGKIYGIPRNSASVLIIDPVAGTADTTTITGIGRGSGVSPDGAVWCGGVLGPDGKIYGIPHNDNRVLVIDPVTQTADTSTITGLDLIPSILEEAKWQGGVLGPDGKIYGIPYFAGRVLVIDPVAETADTIEVSGIDEENGIYGGWCGGVLGPDGKIYGIPGGGANTILIVDPAAGTADTTMISGLPEEDYTSWAGGVLAPNGKIYGIPRDSESVLILTPGLPTMPIEPLLSPYLNKF